MKEINSRWSNADELFDPSHNIVWCFHALYLLNIATTAYGNTISLCLLLKMFLVRLTIMFFNLESSLSSVLIQWLQPQWWRSWLGFQLLRQQRWEEPWQLMKHCGRSFVCVLCILLSFIGKQSCGRMHITEQAVLETLCSGSSGDIRSAINSLQFSSLPGQNESTLTACLQLNTRAIQSALNSLWLPVALQTRHWRRGCGGWGGTELGLYRTKLFLEQSRGRRSPNRWRRRKRSRPLEGKMLLCSCSEHWEKSCTANVSHASQFTQRF